MVGNKAFSLVKPFGKKAVFEELQISLRAHVLPSVTEHRLLVWQICAEWRHPTSTKDFSI